MSDALAEAQALYRESIDASRDQRNQIAEDLAFTDPSNPQQWDEKIKRQRENDPGGVRPCLVHDQLSQYISNVAGQFEQRPPAIHAIPVDSGGDKKVAESLDGMIRHIEHMSRAQQHYARANMSAARAGVGYLTLRPEHTDRALNYQEPRIGSEGDPLRVVLDPWSVEIDGSDANFGYVLTPYSHREFVRKFGEKAEKISFGDIDQKRSNDQRESILTAECWRVDEVSTNVLIAQMQDGEEVSLTEKEYWDRYERENYRPEVLRNYTDKRKRVMWSLMSGAEVLLKEREFPANGIGIVPVYGYVSFVDGRMRYCGMGRRAREPQQSYNLMISEIRAYMNDAPKSPWLVPQRALNGELKKLWDKASAERRAYLPYIDIDTEGPVAAPSRMPLATNLQNLMGGAQQALQDIQAALGMYQANLGAPSNETSGIAIESRKQQGEASTSHFASHAGASIGHVGKLLISMIPRLIDTRRRMRIMGIDNTVSTVAIDPQQEGAVAESDDGLIINPNVGQYDARVVVGAAFSTQRAQAQQAYTEMMRANPQLMPVIGPLWAQTMDVPHADKLAQVLTAMAPPEVQAILKPQDDQPTSAELQAKLQQMQQALQEALQVAQESQQECEQLRAEGGIKEAEVEIKRGELEVKQYEAETKRLALASKHADMTAGGADGHEFDRDPGRSYDDDDGPDERLDIDYDPENKADDSPQLPAPQPLQIHVHVDARQPVSTVRQVMLQRTPNGGIEGTVLADGEAV